MGSPPGYVLVDPEKRGVWETRIARQLVAFGPLTMAICIRAADELCLRQPLAYLQADNRILLWGGWLAAGVGILAGIACGLALSFRTAVPWFMLLAAAVSGASGYLWFAGFVRPWALTVAAIGVPLVGAFSFGAVLAGVWRALWFRAAALGVIERAMSPGFVACALLVLAVAAPTFSALGSLRAGTALGMVLALLAMWSMTLLERLERHRRARITWCASLTTFIAGLTAFSTSSRMVTSREIHQHNSAIVYAHTSERARYIVTSAQDAFALFVNGQLELSTLDGYRYAEALVHPAMTAAQERRHVAVLGGGKGFVEHELLRYDDVETLTVVVVDAALPRLARGAPWRRSAGHALDDEIVRIIEEEPIVWLEQEGPLYDVILVDLADPLSYLEAKNYTVHFYARLRARLTSQGIAAVQATSPFRSPTTFAVIAATARAGGFDVRTYRTPLPAYGEWGFLLLSRGQIDLARGLPPGLAFLDGPGLRALFVAPTDLQSLPTVSPNHLHDMSLLDVFEVEQHTN